jgi:ATP phosphoribosyltransferase regulatory subunit
MIASGKASAGLWTESTRRLRSVEGPLLRLWGDRGFSEVVPPLLVPEAAARSASPNALDSRIVPVREEGLGALALRADFTSGVAWMVSRRVDRLDGPLRLSYSGTVVRQPRPNGGGGIETLQAGCERVSGLAGPEGDEEVLALAAESLLSLGLKEPVLELGHWGLVGPLLDAVPWPAEGREALARTMNRKSLAALLELEDRYGSTAETRMLKQLLHLGNRPSDVEALRPDLSALGAWGTWQELRERAGELAVSAPGLRLRLDPADVRHWDYYTGLTFKAFCPGHPYALLSGGRYDGLYPALGRPFGAVGFALDLGGVCSTLEPPSGALRSKDASSPGGGGSRPDAGRREPCPESP